MQRALKHLLATTSLATLLLAGAAALPGSASAYVLGPTSPGKWGAAGMGTPGGVVTWSLMPTGTSCTNSAALAGSAGSAPPISDAMLALVPEWASFRLRVEGDALVMDGAMPNVPGAPGPDENHANGVASWAPPSTLMLAAGNDAGATLLETIALYRADPGNADVFTTIDQAAGIVGGLDAALGWMGDTGLVIAQGANAPEGGIVSIPTDPAAARQLLTTLRSFATLAGAQIGLTIRDEDHNGTTVTIIDLGSAQDLMGMAGALGGATLPTDPSTMPIPAGNVEIAFAATELGR